MQREDDGGRRVVIPVDPADEQSQGGRVGIGDRQPWAGRRALAPVEGGAGDEQRVVEMRTCDVACVGADARDLGATPALRVARDAAPAVAAPP